MKNLAKLSGSPRCDVPDVLACLRDGQPLMAAEACEKIIADARDWTGCGEEIATKMTRILIGSYPSRQLADADIYSRAIVSVLAEAPASACREAIDKITRSQKFLPTRAEVVSALAKIRATRAATASRAMGHLEEHRKRAEKPDTDRVSAAEIRGLLSKLSQATG